MMKILSKIFFLLLLFSFQLFSQNKILIPMDLSQTDHLKAYGVTFHALLDGFKADWLLNYRGGSFMIDKSDKIISECLLEEVYFAHQDQRHRHQKQAHRYQHFLQQVKCHKNQLHCTLQKEIRLAQQSF